jgi:hypothetical protein
MHEGEPCTDVIIMRCSMHIERTETRQMNERYFKLFFSLYDQL